MLEGWGEKRSEGIFFSGFGMHEHGGGALIALSDCVYAALIYVGAADTIDTLTYLGHCGSAMVVLATGRSWG